jgi:hypothetical protein
MWVRELTVQVNPHALIKVDDSGKQWITVD